MAILTFYQNDDAAIAKLSPEKTAEFESWMEALDVEHQRRGCPYGQKTLAKATGLTCWLGFFEDGFSPADAMQEDLSNA